MISTEMQSYLLPIHFEISDGKHEVNSVTLRACPKFGFNRKRICKVSLVCYRIAIKLLFPVILFLPAIPGTRRQPLKCK